MTADELPPPVGYQWLDTAHYRKRIPADATPEHWRALYTRAALDAVRAQERERCAQIAGKTVCDTHLPTGVRIYGTAAAKAIRDQDQG